MQQLNCELIIETASSASAKSNGSDLLIYKGSVLLRVISVSLKIILKVASRFSKITRRWRACWSRSVRLTLASIPARNNLKQLNKHFIMSFNVNNLPLAPRSRQRTRAPAEVKKRCSGGYHTQLLKGTRKMNWWLISSTRTVFFSYEIGWYSIGVHMSRLYCSFKSFHAFSQHLKTFFCSLSIFQIIPYPSPR